MRALKDNGAAPTAEAASEETRSEGTFQSKHFVFLTF